MLLVITYESVLFVLSHTLLNLPINLLASARVIIIIQASFSAKSLKRNYIKKTNR